MADADEEHFLFVRRYMQFHNIWTVYFDFLSGRYVPSVGAKSVDEASSDWTLPAEMGPTLMFVLYGLFYSLVEDSSDGFNAFRIWRKQYPEEEIAISALEQLVLPMSGDLRLFRNRLAFHGSRNQQHESRGFDLFGNYSGTRMMEVMTQFKALNAALLEKDLARQADSVDRQNKARLRIDMITSRCRTLATG